MTTTPLASYDGVADRAWLLGFGGVVSRKPRSRFRPRKAPSQARAVATVEAILGAAARVLVSRGWAGLTTNRIAERAGVSVGTLYEYFPSKDAVVAALVDRHVAAGEARIAERATALATAALGMEPHVLARELATVMVELHEDDPRLHRVITEEVPHRSETRARIRAVEDRMVDALGALFTTHTAVTAPNPTAAAHIVVGLLESATHRWATNRAGAPLPRDVLLDELTRMIAAYLTVPTGR